MTYKPKRQADENQTAALNKMRGKKAFALLMAMRTRKTKVVLDDFGEMEAAGIAQDLLVIAPAGVYRTWEGAARADLSDDLLDRLRLYIYRSGANKSELAALDEFMKVTARFAHGPRILLMNVEALSSPGRARELVQTFLSQRPGKCVVAIDESTCIMRNSARTKFINKFIAPLAAYKRILSGLATPRSPLDLFYQFEFLDWRILGHQSFFAFRYKYAQLKEMKFGGRRFQVVVGYRPGAAEALQALVEPHSFRVAFRPKVPSTYSIREVTLTPEQLKAYSEIKKYATTELANHAHVTATVVIAQLCRMHQVLCGHVTDELGVEHHLPERRSAAVLEELEDYGGKAIIWFSYVCDLERVMAMLEKEYGPGSTARFYGGNLATREEEEVRFKTNPACRFMGATAGAGGKGRTWHMADLIIYYSNTDNLEHRDQSEQRTMDRDKVIGADFVDLVVPDTVDMKFLHAMRKKIVMASAINGDNWREWVV